MEETKTINTFQWVGTMIYFTNHIKYGNFISVYYVPLYEEFLCPKAFFPSMSLPWFCPWCICVCDTSYVCGSFSCFSHLGSGTGDSLSLISAPIPPQPFQISDFGLPSLFCLLCTPVETARTTLEVAGEASCTCGVCLYHLAGLYVWKISLGGRTPSSGVRFWGTALWSWASKLLADLLPLCMALAPPKIGLTHWKHLISVKLTVKKLNCQPRYPWKMESCTQLPSYNVTKIVRPSHTMESRTITKRIKKVLEKSSAPLPKTDRQTKLLLFFDSPPILPFLHPLIFCAHFFVAL